MGVKITPGSQFYSVNIIKFNTVKQLTWEDNLGGEKVAVHFHHGDCSIGVGRLFERLVQDHWDSNLQSGVKQGPGVW